MSLSWVKCPEISACGSPLLIETFGRGYLQFRQQFVGQQRDFGANYFEAIIAEHQAIVDAALARDQEACRRAIFEQIVSTIRWRISVGSLPAGRALPATRTAASHRIQKTAPASTN